MDTAAEWTKNHPIGTNVKIKFTSHIATHKVASHAFRPPTPILVLLDDGSCVAISRLEPHTDQK
jgi:hypothetical protein